MELRNLVEEWSSLLRAFINLSSSFSDPMGSVDFFLSNYGRFRFKFCLQRTTMGLTFTQDLLKQAHWR